MKTGRQIILNYVEGNMKIDEFQYEFINNKQLQKDLQKKINKEYLKRYQFSLFNYFTNDKKFQHDNWETPEIRYSVQINLIQWLLEYGISYVKYSKYEQDYDYLLDILPPWLDILDDKGIFDKILLEAPSDVSRKKRVQWGKARIKELFRYDKTYPRWVQSPEWPIINGKPLVFSHQSKEKADDARVYFYFYDADTKEEFVVEQLY